MRTQPSHSASAPATTRIQSRLSSEYWLSIAEKEFRLAGKSIRIGRAIDNDIVLEHKSCSRNHAIISFSQGRVLIEDLQSRNGIRVNGQSVRRAELRDGDEIRIGDLDGHFAERAVREYTLSRKEKPDSTGKQIGLLGKIKDALSKKTATSAEPSPSGKKKLITISALVLLGLFLLINVFKGGPSSSDKATVPESERVEIVDSSKFDKYGFERCAELEDLGNFRQATACLKKLARTQEVQAALLRVQKRQNELSEKRFVEGSKAFENYYYDIAILKWQEVLLIADDASEYRTKAMSGIQKAEERKRLK